MPNFTICNNQYTYQDKTNFFTQLRAEQELNAFFSAKFPNKKSETGYDAKKAEEFMRDNPHDPGLICMLFDLAFTPVSGAQKLSVVLTNNAPEKEELAMLLQMVKNFKMSTPAIAMKPPFIKNASGRTQKGKKKIA